MTKKYSRCGNAYKNLRGYLWATESLDRLRRGLELGACIIGGRWEGWIGGGEKLYPGASTIVLTRDLPFFLLPSVVNEGGGSRDNSYAEIGLCHKSSHCGRILMAYAIFRLLLPHWDVLMSVLERLDCINTSSFCTTRPQWILERYTVLCFATPSLSVCELGCPCLSTCYTRISCPNCQRGQVVVRSYLDPQTIYSSHISHHVFVCHS